MINRIAGRLIKLSNITTLNLFWSSDGSKSGGKGGRGSFFGKKDKKRDEGEPSQPVGREDLKEPHHKTVRFLKKHELKLKDIEPQPKKQLRFRKKQTYDEAQAEKPAPFVKSENEENEQQLIKKSIFFTQSSQSAPPPPRQEGENFISSQPQLKQFLTSPAPQNKFYDRLSEDLDRIFVLFEGKNWKELNEIVHNYHQYTSAHDVEKELHSLLINTDVSNYLEWLRSVGRGFKNLSDATLKKLYSGLVAQHKGKELKELLAFFKTRLFNVEYKSIDLLLADIEKESPLQGLEQKVNEKIDLALDVLAVQLKYNQKHEAAQTVVVYTLDEWFGKLAHLALSRHVSRAKFTALFEEIFIRHFEYINLEHIHASGLFLDIVEANYFGSYITTAKLQGLFEDSIHSTDFEFHMIKLRDRLMGYRVKTGKFAFPNARRLLEQFQRNFAKERFGPTLFYYVLLGFSYEPRDTQSLMEKRRILINFAQRQYDIRQLLDDPLWALDYKFFESQTAKSAEESPAEAESAIQEAEEKQAEKEKGEQTTPTEAGSGHEEEQATSTFQKKSKKSEEQQDEELRNIGKKKSWRDYQYNKDRVQQRPKHLGWPHYKQLESYHAMLVKQIEQEANPYRKELLQNIIQAKLNLETDLNLVTASHDSKDATKSDRSTQGEHGAVKTDERGKKRLDSKQEEEEVEAYAMSEGEEELEFEEQQETEEMSSEDVEVEPRKPHYRSLDEYIQQFGSDKLDQNEMMAEKFEYHNMLAIKSAIKLKKYELALGLCEKIIMEPLIIERTSKNISMVVKSFLLEEHAKLRKPNIEDILEQVDRASNELSNEYLRSVYDRCDSFDELIWRYTPRKDVKFLYWRTALAMSRGKQLVEMEANGKLSTMQYEPEYDELPVRPRDQFIAKEAGNWRESLMIELGLVQPRKNEDLALQFKSATDQEFFDETMVLDIFHTKRKREYRQNIVFDRVNNALAEYQAQQGLLQEAADETVPEPEQEVPQEGEVAEETTELAVEAVAEEAVEAVAEGSEEAVEAAEGAAVGESAAVGEEGVREESIHGSEETSVSQKKPHKNRKGSALSQQIEDIDSQAERILFGASSFEEGAGRRVRGYDFPAFLQLAQQNIKPALEEQYEEEKEYKKHVINLHSLAEESRISDVIYLQKKLHEYQRHVKSISNIATFLSFGLWNFPFKKFTLKPRKARMAAKRFREKFYRFCKYEGQKGFNNKIVLNNERARIRERYEILLTMKFSEAMVDDLLIHRMRLFKEAEAVVKLPPSAAVEELMLWGLRSDEPMGIYLAEKIAMLTNQVIPHELASQVGVYLSHRREVPAERVERCKEALRVVGRINRDHIYDFHQEYQHITHRKHFAGYLQKRTAELDSSSLEFLARLDPTHAHQPGTAKITADLRRGGLVV